MRRVAVGVVLVFAVGLLVRSILRRNHNPKAEDAFDSVKGEVAALALEAADRAVDMTDKVRSKERSKAGIVSTVDNVKGRAKQAAGDLTGDIKLKGEGKVDRAKGKVKEAVDKVADKATSNG